MARFISNSSCLGSSNPAPTFSWSVVDANKTLETDYAHWTISGKSFNRLFSSVIFSERFFTQSCVFSCFSFLDPHCKINLTRVMPYANEYFQNKQENFNFKSVEHLVLGETSKDRLVLE